MLNRHGLTLAELLVSMTVAGVVLSMIASVSAREQRVFADLADRAALAGQLRDASSVLPIDLRSVASAAGDIRDARDSSLEIRATIASAVVCDSTATSIILAPAIGGAATHASVVTSIEAGDTLWLLSVTDTAVWKPYRVAAAGNAPAGQCAPRGPQLADSARIRPRTSVSLATTPTATIGMPARVTRPVRYSIYRASDGAWYLGEKDWSNTSAKFNTIQPVAGPFLAAAAGGVVFRYADSLGAAIASPVADRTSIASIRVELRGQTSAPARAIGAAQSTGKRTDSSIVIVSLRNRR